MTTTDQPKPETSPAVRATIALVLTALAAVSVMLLGGPAAYLWIKAVHVIAIISWMAGMLYLPRLFIYHCDAPKSSERSEPFKVMGRRLLRLLMTPAMIIAWALGMWLAWHGGWLHSGWFHAKLSAALALSGVHGYFSAAVRAFAEDRNTRSARFWRIMNEVPTVLMIAIVILVIVKPF